MTLECIEQHIRHQSTSLPQLKNGLEIMQRKASRYRWLESTFGPGVLMILGTTLSETQ